MSIDYLQALIDRDDVYDPAPPELAPRAAPGRSGPPRPRRSRLLGLDTIRVLAAGCVVSWSIVAVETWLLVR